MMRWVSDHVTASVVLLDATLVTVPGPSGSRVAGGMVATGREAAVSLGTRR